MKTMLSLVLSTLLLLSGCTSQPSQQIESPTLQTEEEQTPPTGVATQADRPENNSGFTLSLTTLPEDYPDLLCSPAFDKEKAVFVFFEPPQGSSYNVFEYDMQTKTNTELPIRAWSQVQLDDNAYYYLEGEVAQGMSRVQRLDRATGETQTLYTAPEGIEIAPNLSFCDGFLLWAQFDQQADRKAGFALWAFDLERQEAFTVYEKCYGFVGYPYILHGGYVAFYTEDPAAQQPYLLSGYDLVNREVCLTLPVEKEPGGMVFDGHTFAWSDRAENVLHYATTQDLTAHDVDIGVSFVNLLDENHLIYATLQDEICIYNIKQEAIVFSSANAVSLDEREVLNTVCTIDAETGTAAFVAFHKSAEPNQRDERILWISPA